MDEIEAMISGDMIGAGLSPDDIALARALVNSGIAGDIDVIGDDLDDIGAEIDIVGAEEQKPKTRRTVSATQLRNVVQRNAAKMARQMVTQGRATGNPAPVAVEKRVE